MASSPPPLRSDGLLWLASPLPRTSDPWVILRTVPRVVDAQARDDREVFFERAHPPHLISFLSVSARCAGQGSSSPRILAADLSASLFLTVAPTPHPRASATDVCYLVLDAARGISHRIPDPAPGFSRFGVIAVGSESDTSRFMVVGLRFPIGNDDRATLDCYTSWTAGLWQPQWYTMDVNNPRPHFARTLSDVVIAHDGKLWWVDTSGSSNTGLLYCDPSADQPSMSFVPFPEHVTAVEAKAGARAAYDYVQVAERTIRWVHVVCGPLLNGGAPLLSIYAVVLDPGGDGYRMELELLPRWRSQFSFCFIWESPTFKATEMPKTEQPVLAFIDPNNTDLLYFFLGDYIFGFDIFKRVMLGCDRHGMAHPDVSSSAPLLAWKLPPAPKAPSD